MSDRLLVRVDRGRAVWIEPGTPLYAYGHFVVVARVDLSRSTVWVWVEGARGWWLDWISRSDAFQAVRDLAYVGEEGS